MPFYRAKLMKTYSESKFHYVTLWVPNVESELHEELFQAAVEGHEYNELATPEGLAETLHKDDRVEVCRIRYPHGWLYSVTNTLGFPWPSHFSIPVLSPTRAAPLVAVEQEGTAVIHKFWVQDGTPFSPAF